MGEICDIKGLPTFFSFELVVFMVNKKERNTEKILRNKQKMFAKGKYKYPEENTLC